MLTLTQKRRKTELDAIIDQHIKDFVMVATALAEYKRDRLWEDEHDSWEAFCRIKFDKCRSYGYELAAAAEVLGNLSGIPDCPQPSAISQVRPLAQLEPEQQPEAMKAATAIAPDNKPTAQHVQRAATAIKSKPETPFQPGIAATVLDESSPHYGQQVEVVQTEGVIVQAKTQSGETMPFLKNELTTDETAKPSAEKTWAQKPKPNPLETVELENEVLRQRCQLLEQRLQEAINLLQQFPSSPRLRSFVSEAQSLLA